MQRTSVLLGVLAAVCLAAWRLPTERWTWAGWVLLGLGLAALLANGVIAWVQIGRKVKLRSDVRILIDSVFGVVSRTLAQMPTQPAREINSYFERVVMTALDGALGLTPSKRGRATVFWRRRDGDVDVFEPEQTAGRGDPPRSIFARGTVEGDDVFDTAIADENRFVEDVTETQPPGWDQDRKRHYRTFITVPIRSGDVCVGLLTLNSPDPGDLTDEDVGALRALAELIGAAVGIRDRVGAPRHTGGTPAQEVNP